MHNLILHIGMPKTGSTSIQFSLFNLNTERFFYPNLGGVCHNLSLCSLFSKNPQDIHLNRDRTLEEINKYIKNVRHKLRKILQTENKIIILSGEGIPILSKNEIFKMKKFFNKFGRDKILIFAYIRKPMEYLTTAFQQSLKISFNGFNNLSKLLPNYRNSFEKFDNVFGMENVKLYKFDRNNFPDRNVVLDFCSRFGIEIDPQKIIFANESLTMEAVKFIYTYKKFTKKNLYAGEAKWISSFISKCTNNVQKFRISPRVLKPIIERVKYDIEWMEKRLTDSLYESFEELPDDIKSEDDLINIEKSIIEKLCEYLNNQPQMTKDKITNIINVVEAIRKKYKQNFINRGIIMRVTSNLISGFAIGENFERPLKLYLYVNGKLINETVANKYHLTLSKMGISDGKYGFHFSLDSKHSLKEGDIVEVKTENESCKIYNSPFTFKDELNLTWAHLAHISEIF